MKKDQWSFWVAGLALYMDCSESHLFHVNISQTINETFIFVVSSSFMVVACESLRGGIIGRSREGYHRSTFSDTRTMEMVSSVNLW